MKEAHVSIEKFFTEALSKTLGRPIPVSVQWVEFEEIDIPNPSYHKSVSLRVIEQYSKEFNPVVAGFMAANIRPNGRVALVDGRHRRELAVRSGHKGWWCLLTDGCTEQEEAKMFRLYQNRKNQTTAEGLRGRILEKDPQAMLLKGAVNSAGYSLSFEDDSEHPKIWAIDAVISIFQRGGPGLLKDVLSYPTACWFGNEKATSRPILMALRLVLTTPEFADKLNKAHLVSTLRKLDPDSIMQRGKMVHVQERCNAVYGIASIIRLEYNKGLKSGERVEFDFAHAPRVESSKRKGNFMLPSMGSIPKKMPDKIAVPPELEAEVERRRSLKRSSQIVSRELQAFLETLAERGYSNDEIAAVCKVGPSVMIKVRRRIYLKTARRKAMKGQ